MKIVVTIHHFPPNYSAGAEVYAFRLSSWLVQHGHDVQVVCIESISNEGKDEIEHTHDIYEGVSVHRLYIGLVNDRDFFRRSYDNPIIQKWFTAFLERERPDLVHINSCYLLSANTVAVVKEQDLPLIVTLHDFWFVCPRITLLKPTGALCRVPKDVAECAWCLATEKRRFRRTDEVTLGAAGVIAQHLVKSSVGAKLLGVYPDAGEIARRRERLLKALNQADLILAPSRFLRDIFVEQGIPPAKIQYSRLGLDARHWKNVSSSVKTLSDKVQITYIGQLAPHKGVDLLIDAFNQVMFSQRGARLRIYGDPKAFPVYARSIQKAARGNRAIEFNGRFDNSRVAEILNETDFLVVPSLWYENSPVTIMEALATGTPVVAANLGGIPELIQHGVNGLLFEAGNVKDLTNQLQRLLDSPELITQLASQVRPGRTIDDEMEQIVASFYTGLIVSQQAVE